MQIKNSFEVPLPPAEAWRVLMDIPRIAPCVPGAELTGRTEDGGYQGKVSVRLGPVALAFGGVARIVEQDDARFHARIEAGGEDLKGRGSARAELRFDLSPSGTGSRAEIVTDVTLSGLVAQYGRGTGVIQSVATQIVNQFAANLSRMIQADRADGVDPDTAGATQRPQGAASAPPPSKPVGVFSLLFAVLRDRLKALFARS
jgi:uncharacterized protein